MVADRMFLQLLETKFLLVACVRGLPRRRREISMRQVACCLIFDKNMQPTFATTGDNLSHVVRRIETSCDMQPATIYLLSMTGFMLQQVYITAQ